MNRVNNQITDASVIVIDDDGTNLGTMQTAEAIKLAHTKSLDLIEVGRGVCKVQSWEKFRYQQQKAHKAKPAPEMKEFRFGIKIQDHDLDTKARQINELVIKGHPIKIVVRLVGRENAHPEKGLEVIERLKSRLEHAVMDPPKQEGNTTIAHIRKSQ